MGQQRDHPGRVLGDASGQRQGLRGKIPGDPPKTPPSPRHSPGAGSYTCCRAARRRGGRRGPDFLRSPAAAGAGAPICASVLIADIRLFADDAQAGAGHIGTGRRPSARANPAGARGASSARAEMAERPIRAAPWVDAVCFFARADRRTSDAAGIFHLRWRRRSSYRRGRRSSLNTRIPGRSAGRTGRQALPPGPARRRAPAW